MNLKQLPKKMWMAFAVLFCSVVSAQAAEITYSLTTHVDGRTITGVANVAEGASLEDNMPQDLWRGYTTYKYYSDQALTQEITTAPAEDATVYVDYVFDPPFQMSNDNKTVWNYLRNYNGGGSTQRYVYYDTRNGNIHSQDNTSVTSTKKIEWAFYGDGYSFQAKVNDNSIANPWLIWTDERQGNIFIGYYYYLALGAQPEVGWQIYTNTATSFNRPGGTVALGRPDNKNLAYLPDGGLEMRTEAIQSDEHHFDNHNQLVANHTGSSSQATIERDDLWWYAFFASPTTSSPTTPDIWHVTYKIQKEDGTWYDDIVVQKSSSNLTPTWPVEGFTEAEGCEYDYFYTDATFTEKFEGAMPNDRNSILYIKESVSVPEIYYVTYKIQKGDGTWYEDIVIEKTPNNLTPTWPVEGFTPVEGYEYDYFYKDADFSDKCEEDYTMPADENTVLYIQENLIIEWVSEPWKTLVIPFGIENLASFFGLDYEGVPAVDVLELQGIEEGVVTPAGNQEFYRCKLIFNPVDFILPYKPYLIRVNRADARSLVEMYLAEGERSCEVTTVEDPANAGISVSMEGTLEPNGYVMDASDGLHFYFGYDDQADAYNFYRVTATIPKNRCWFYVNDNRATGAKLNVTFDMDAITGIGQVVSAKAADGRIYNMSGQQVQNTLQKGIYIVNGKKVIVK